MEGHDGSNESSFSFWQNQAKAEYNWNVTSAINWNAVNTFINIAVSPLGDLYGIQAYNDGRTNVQYAYKFDFNLGQWNIFDSQQQVKGLRFDKLGNIYLIDRSDSLILNSNRSRLLSNI